MRWSLVARWYERQEVYKGLILFGDELNGNQAGRKPGDDAESIGDCVGDGGVERGRSSSRRSEFREGK
jgi:hypothetical protein